MSRMIALGSIFSFSFAVIGVEAATDETALVPLDFESGSYEGWEVRGEAFGGTPAAGALDNQMPVTGYEGTWLVNSYLGGDGTEGELLSDAFTISRPYINFLVGGGYDPELLQVNLIVGDAVVASTTGINAERLSWRTWEVGAYAGKPGRIQIVDHATGGWGHLNADHFIQSEEYRAAYKNPAIASAMAGVEALVPQADADPTRPRYHFRAPARWINDPNGPFLLDGTYHVFYQHNPYADQWGHMHWGHASSQDLVRWNHEPIALWPSRELGELHCFSGCAVIDAEGKPVILYTSVGDRANEQWAAIPGNGTLTAWRKHPKNPILRLEGNGAPPFGRHWRDPFVFREAGRTFMVIGADTEEEALLPIYECESGDLTEWVYRGILFRRPKDEIKFFECPNFFRTGDSWVLLTSPYGPLRYYVGGLDLDSYQFRPGREGLLEHSGQYYATNVIKDVDGANILLAWVRGFQEGHGWNGCFALPRVFEVDAAGGPRQRPLPHFASLRYDPISIEGFELTDAVQTLDGLGGDELEIQIEFEPTSAEAYGLLIHGREAGDPVVLRMAQGIFDIAGSSVPLPEKGPRAPLSLQVFLDRSVIEVFIDDGRETVTKVIYPRGGVGSISVFAEQGTVDVGKVDAWRMRGTW